MFEPTVWTYCLSGAEQVWLTLPSCAPAFVAIEETPRTKAAQAKVAAIRRPARTKTNIGGVSEPSHTSFGDSPAWFTTPGIEHVERPTERIAVDPVRLRVLDRAVHPGRRRLAVERMEQVCDRERVQ